jgi:hypothetical protein
MERIRLPRRPALFLQRRKRFLRNFFSEANDNLLGTVPIKTLIFVGKKTDDNSNFTYRIIRRKFENIKCFELKKQRCQGFQTLNDLCFRISQRFRILILKAKRG